MADVVKTLGLTGNGVGRLVAVRDPRVLLDTGFMFTATETTLVELDPPDAVISITGREPPLSQTRKNLAARIDDLIAFTEKKQKGI